MHACWSCLPRCEASRDNTMTSGLFSGQRDGADLAPVVGLAAVGGAAIAEEAQIRVGAKREILHPVDAGAIEPRRHIAGEIEDRMAFTCRRHEEALIVFV